MSSHVASTSSSVHGLQVPEVLRRVELLLEENRPQEALELIQQFGQKTRLLENARGVCLLRLGQTEQAARVLAELIFVHGGVCIPPETPTIYQTNYVTAMLLSGQAQSGREVLDQIFEVDHPAVRRLKAAMKAWMRELGPMRRLMALWGSYPACPVPLDFPPGDLR